MKKSLTLLLAWILLILPACSGGDNGKGALAESRFYIPVSHRIYAEDGTLLREQTIALDEDGYMTEISVKETGYRGKNQSYTFSVENIFDEADMTLTQDFSAEKDGESMFERYRYHFDKDGILIGMTSFRQGESYLPIAFNPDDYTWLDDEGNPVYPAIDGAAYPKPFAYQDENGKVLLTLSEEELANNPYAQKIAEEIGYTGEIEFPSDGSAVALPEDYVDKRSFIEAILGATLWQSCGVTQEDGSVIVRVAYENGALAEEVIFKPVTLTAYGAYLGFDWDWFGGGILDATVFFDRTPDKR